MARKIDTVNQLTNSLQLNSYAQPSKQVDSSQPIHRFTKRCPGLINLPQSPITGSLGLVLTPRKVSVRVPFLSPSVLHGTEAVSSDTEGRIEH